MIFAKAPVPGKVKTRLIPALGEDGASAFYERMALHCIAVGVGARVGAVDLWCAPSSDHPFFVRCARRFQVNLRDQIEGDLGERMIHAFSEAFRLSPVALLMGSDCPSLTSKDIWLAKTVLDRGDDAVIVPSEDGGYVLLGLKHPAPELFRGVPWGTDRVLSETRARLLLLGWRWQELTEKWDVDRPEDLERLRHELRWNFSIEKGEGNGFDTSREEGKGSRI